MGAMRGAVTIALMCWDVHAMTNDQWRAAAAVKYAIAAQRLVLSQLIQIAAAVLMFLNLIALDESGDALLGGLRLVAAELLLPLNECASAVVGGLSIAAERGSSLCQLVPLSRGTYYAWAKILRVLSLSYLFGVGAGNSVDVEIYKTDLCHPASDATANVSAVFTICDHHCSFEQDTAWNSFHSLVCTAAFVVIFATIGVFLFTAFLLAFIGGDIRQRVVKQVCREERDRRRCNRAIKKSTHPLPRGYRRGSLCRSILKLRDREHIEESKCSSKDRANLPWPRRTTKREAQKGVSRPCSASSGRILRLRTFLIIVAVLAMLAQLTSAHDGDHKKSNCTMPAFVEDRLPEGANMCAARSAWLAALANICLDTVCNYCNRGHYDDQGELQKDHFDETRDYSRAAWGVTLAKSVVIALALMWLGVQTSLLEVFDEAKTATLVYFVLLGCGALFVGFMQRWEGKSFDANGIERVPIYKNWKVMALDQLNSAVAITLLLNGVCAVILVCRGDNPPTFMLPHMLPLIQLLLAILWVPIVRSWEGPKIILKTMGVNFLSIFAVDVYLYQYALLHWPKMNWGTKADGAQADQSERMIKKRLRLQRISACKFILLQLANTAGVLVLCMLFMANADDDKEYDEPVNATAAEAALETTVWIVSAPIGAVLCLAILAWLQQACSPICTRCVDAQERQILNNPRVDHECIDQIQTAKRCNLTAGHREGEIFLSSDPCDPEERDVLMDTAHRGDKLKARRQCRESDARKLAKSTAEPELEPEQQLETPTATPSSSDNESADKPSERHLESNLDGDLSTFADGRPQDSDPDLQACTYFGKLSFPDAFLQRMALVVTVYSEMADELHKTLSSLLSTAAIRGVYIKVLLVFDGVYKDGEKIQKEKKKEKNFILPKCTRDYLTTMFPKLGDWSRFCPEDGDLQQTTVVPEALATGDSAISGDLQNRPDMDVSLVIKQSNRQKANSIDWALQFGYEIACEWIFFTDVGTMYAKYYFWHLVEHLKRNPHTAGCTGTQRAIPMSLDWQKTNADGKPYVDIKDPGINDPGAWAYFLRMLQEYEVEAQNPVSRAISNFFGYMPVLSGPGALYKFDVLYPRRKQIFDFINKPDVECSGVELNFRRGEDRIFSQLVVFCRECIGAYKTHWVPLAVHYWSVETKLRKLLAQRERWINAAVAFYSWMLAQWELITGSDHSFGMRAWALFSLILGYICLITLALAPAITNALVWILTYRILALDSTHVASSGSGVELELIDDQLTYSTLCLACEAVPGSVATDAWCMVDCVGLTEHNPDICRCI